MAQRSLAKRVWYSSLQTTLRLIGVSLFHARVYGRENIPATGGGLVLCNHQSHLDPMLMGMASDRRMNFLARETLFSNWPMRKLMKSLDAIPIDREGSGISGLKETLRRVRSDELVMIFPEGTRSPDGAIHQLKPGFCALAKRAGVPLVPAAIHGAFQAWPRDRAYPLPAPVQVCFGEPLPFSEIGKFTDQQLIAEVDRRIRECFDRCAAKA